MDHSLDKIYIRNYIKISTSQRVYRRISNISQYAIEYHAQSENQYNDSIKLYRFKLKIVKTGSYYDEAKVGEPDEFDYVAELEPLSHNSNVIFEPTGDPVFMQIKLKSLKLETEWMSYRSDRNKIQKARDESM